MNRTKKSIKDIFNTVLGLIILISFGFIMYKLTVLLIDGMKTLFENYTTIAVALVTGLFAFVSAIVGKIVEHKLSIDNQIREERQAVYIDFLDWLVSNVLYNEISNNENIGNELKEQQKKMTIYASDKVLKSWSSFKNVAANSVFNKKGMNKEEQTNYYINNEAPYIEERILSIRKELGYKNKNLKKYDILRLYILDIEKYIK